MNRAYIGIGSNQDHPEQQIKNAIHALKALEHTQLIVLSTVYWSRPIGPSEANFLNAVGCLVTSLTPFELLRNLHIIETNQGRIRAERWGARTLDLDLLLYENICIQDPSLTVPHPEMQRRDFVMHLLAEIAPDLILPDGQSVQEVLKKCPIQNLLGPAFQIPISDLKQ